METSHTVQIGDTLSKIAREHGVSLDALLEANPQIQDESLIFLGQVIALPGSARPAVPEEVVVLSRDQWGAKSLPRLGGIVARSARTHVYIHHTVTPSAGATPNEWDSFEEVSKKMQQLQTMRPDLGRDVPYSMVAFPMADGRLVLAEGRGIDRSGAHTSGHNTAALGISFAGNYEDFEPAATIDSHLAALGRWLGQLRDGQGFRNLGTVHPGNRKVFGHRDQKSTACPGKHIYDRLGLVVF